MACNIILTHARSGSTQLHRALGRAAVTGRQKMEPFARHRAERGIEIGTPAYDALFDEVVEYGLVKHIWSSIPLADTARLLARPEIGRVLFLFRQDTFAAAVSRLVARQLQLWERPEAPLEGTLEDLPEAELVRLKQHLDQTIAHFDAVLTRSGLAWQAIRYEELFGPGTLADKTALLQDLVAFLGFRPRDIGAGADMLMPARYRPEAFYDRIPNYRALKRAFGPATGPAIGPGGDTGG